MRFRRGEESDKFLLTFSIRAAISSPEYSTRTKERNGRIPFSTSPIIERRHSYSLYETTANRLAGLILFNFNPQREISRPISFFDLDDVIELPRSGGNRKSARRFLTESRTSSSLLCARNLAATYVTPRD